MLHGKLDNKLGHFSLIKEFSLAPSDSFLLIFHKIFATNTESPVLNCLHKDFKKSDSKIAPPEVLLIAHSH